MKKIKMPVLTGIYRKKSPFRTLGNSDSDVDGQERDRISVSRATLKMNHLGNVSGNEPVKGASVAGKAQGTQFPKNCGFDCVSLLGYGIHADILPLLDWFSTIIALNQAGSKRIKNMLRRLCQRQRMDSRGKNRGH